MSGLERSMRRYRVTDRHGDVIAEGSFSTFGEAKEWAGELDVDGGCTLHHRTSSGWSVLRRYPGEASADVRRTAHG